MTRIISLGTRVSVMESTNSLHKYTRYHYICNIWLDRLEAVECFKYVQYLGSNVNMSVGNEVEVCQRVNEACKGLGACKSFQV